MTRKALGRGLSALLEDTSSSTGGLQQIPLDSIDPSPFQPRRAMAEERLKELADSIRATGVLQPVLVRKLDERYQLIAGERRWRAARLAQLELVPAVVRELGDSEALEVALTENLLREDLSPIETARAYEKLQEGFGYSHDQIASRLGIDRTTVTNTLRLLKLSPAIQDMIESKQLSAGHARALMACPDAKIQIGLAQQIAKRGLSVRQAERLATARRATPPNQEAKPLDPNLRAAVLELERTLGTRVKIVGSEVRGHIEISYYSQQDLSRLYDWLVRK